MNLNVSSPAEAGGWLLALPLLFQMAAAAGRPLTEPVPIQYRTSRRSALTAFFFEQLFAQGIISGSAALIAIAMRSFATEPHVETEGFFPRIHRRRPAYRAGRRDRASARYRRPGLRPVLQFWQFRWTATVATAQQRIRRWWLVRRRCIRAVSTANTAATRSEASGAETDTGGFFQGAAS
jgi:hypothetical protein